MSTIKDKLRNQHPIFLINSLVLYCKVVKLLTVFNVHDEKFVCCLLWALLTLMFNLLLMPFSLKMRGEEIQQTPLPLSWPYSFVSQQKLFPLRGEKVCFFDCTSPVVVSKVNQFSFQQLLELVQVSKVLNTVKIKHYIALFLTF